MPPKRRISSVSASKSSETAPPSAKRAKQSEGVITTVISQGEDVEKLPEIFQVIHQTQEDSDNFFNWILCIKNKHTRGHIVDYFHSLASDNTLHDKTRLEIYAASDILSDDVRENVLKETVNLQDGIKGAGKWKRMERTTGLYKLEASERLVYLSNWFLSCK